MSFLVNDVGVSLRVREDFGRTPVHDAFWRAEPDLDLLCMLLDRAPELLMLTDKRGHTPMLLETGALGCFDSISGRKVRQVYSLYNCLIPNALLCNKCRKSPTVVST